MREAQQVEGPWRSPRLRVRSFPVAAGPLERHQPRLLRVDRQAVLLESLGQHVHHPPGVLFTGEPHDKSSSPGEFHPQALTEPDVRLAPHPALITRPLVALPRRVPPHRWVDPATKLGDWAPSLHAHYRHFHAVGSEEARRSAGLRPPLKLDVRFSRIQLSQRRVSNAGLMKESGRSGARVPTRRTADAREAASSPDSATS